MEDLTVQVAELLDEYEEGLDDAVNIEMHAVAKEAAEKLKATSPRKTGEYAQGWTVKNDFDNKTYTVYNKAKPSLTHLLENGHLEKNQFGVYGRTEAKKHIKPVEEWAIEETVERITKRLNNG